MTLDRERARELASHLADAAAIAWGLAKLLVSEWWESRTGGRNG